MKEAKAAALQELRPDCHREGGECNEFKRESKYRRGFANNVPNPIKVYAHTSIESLKYTVFRNNNAYYENSWKYKET